MQALFAIFVAEIINNFRSEFVALSDSIILFEIFFVFGHSFVKEPKQILYAFLFSSRTFN